MTYNYKLITAAELAERIIYWIDNEMCYKHFDVTLDNSTEDPCGWWRLGFTKIADGKCLTLAYYGGEWLYAIPFGLIMSEDDIKEWLVSINKDNGGDGIHFVVKQKGVIINERS